MSAFVLKIIAVVTMIIDHSAAVFPTDISYILRSVGRIAFPIYVFFIAEGCRYTKNIWKYMLRLGIYALISEIPFDLCFNSGRFGVKIDFLNSTNVFFTLFLGVLAVAEYGIIKTQHDLRKSPSFTFQTKFPFVAMKTSAPSENDSFSTVDGLGKIELNISMFNKFISKIYQLIRYLPAFIPVLGCMLLADVLGTDYGFKGVVWIFAVFLCGTKAARIICIFIGIVYMYGMNIFDLFVDCLFKLNFSGLINSYSFMSRSYLTFGCACVSVLMLIFYNGKRGKNIKMFFYLIYPVHLTFLGVLRLVLN